MPPAQLPFPPASWLAIVRTRERDAVPIERIESRTTRFLCVNSRTLELALMGSGAGRLPARVEEGAVTVLFDGVLHDIESQPRTGPDAGAAEILRRYTSGFAQARERAFDTLRGSFVAFIVDARDDVILMLRDPLGSHPLFMTVGLPERLLSPSMEAIATALPAARRPNRLYLASTLCNREIGPQATFFEHIERVPPGHVVGLDVKGTSAHRYWDPGPVAGRRGAVDGASPDEFDRLLRGAVARCLQHGAAGVYMSGGIDSTTIAAVARDESSRLGLLPPIALSVLIPEAFSGEARVQRSVAAALDIAQLVRSVPEPSARRPHLLSVVETIANTGSSGVSYLASAYDELAIEARGLEREVLLTGEGGDEWLQVHPTYYFSDLLKGFRLRELSYLLASHRRYTAAETTASFLRDMLWRFTVVALLRQSAHSALERTVSRNRRMRVSAKRLIGWQFRRLIPPGVAPDEGLRVALVDRWRTLSAQEQDFDRYTRLRRRFLFHHGLSSLREKAFERGTRLGLLSFEPYHDPDLVQFLYDASPTALTQGGRARGLAHASFWRRVGEAAPLPPRPVYHDAFAAAIARAEVPPVLRKMGGLQLVAELGLVDARWAGDTSAESLTDPGGVGHAIVELLLMEAWLRAWSDTSDRGVWGS